MNVRFNMVITVLLTTLSKLFVFSFYFNSFLHLKKNRQFQTSEPHDHNCVEKKANG